MKKGIPKTKQIKAFLIASACIAVGGKGYLAFQNNTFAVKYHKISTQRGSGIRILQLSDLHDKQFGKNNIQLLKKIREINPDLVLITGDTVNCGGKNMLATAKFLRSLANEFTVYGVLGNHEQRGDIEEFIEASISASGVKLLKNQQADIEINNVKISILGLCEKQAIYRMDYLKGLFGMLSHENHEKELLKLENSEGIRILLSHFPENYALIGNNSYSMFDFEVMLSGHTHGGQVRLPLIGGIYAPGQGLFPRYAKGLYKQKNNSLMVSAGLGNDGPIPRVNNRPTVDVIDFV